MLKSKSTNQIYSNVSGVASGPEASTRQDALAEIRDVLATGRPVFLDVIPEPTNAFDPDALQLFWNSPSMGRIQVGYVRNGQSECGFCRQTYQRYPGNGECRRCGHADVRRTGLASEIAQTLREDPTTHWYAQVQEIRGGTDGKESLGANIVLRRVALKPGGEKR